MLTAQFYSASYTEDMRHVVHHLSQQYPEAWLLAAGWSLGANILVNYLAEEGMHSKVMAAASMCNPFNLPLCDQNLKRGFARLYDRDLASSMKTVMLKKHLHLFEGYDVDKAMAGTTIRDIDDVITRVTFGETHVTFCLNEGIRMEERR